MARRHSLAIGLAMLTLACRRAGSIFFSQHGRTTAWLIMPSCVARNFPSDPGWPIKTGNPSGEDGRSNLPSIEFHWDRRFLFRKLFRLYDRKNVEECFKEENVTFVAVGGKATIMLLENGGTFWTDGLPNSLCDLLEGPNKKQSIPRLVALGSDDRYYVEFKDGSFQWFGCRNMITSLNTTNRFVKSSSFGKDWDSFFIVFEDGGWSCANVPPKLDELVQGRNKESLKCVMLGPNGEYFLKAQNGQAWWGGMTQEAIDRIAESRYGLYHMSGFGGDDTWLCLYM